MDYIIKIKFHLNFLIFNIILIRIILILRQHFQLQVFSFHFNLSIIIYFFQLKFVIHPTINLFISIINHFILLLIIIQYIPINQIIALMENDFLHHFLHLYLIVQILLINPLKAYIIFLIILLNSLFYIYKIQ